MALVYVATFACFCNHHPILKSAPSEAFSSDSAQLKPYLFSLLESSNMAPKKSPQKTRRKKHGTNLQQEESWNPDFFKKSIGWVVPLHSNSDTPGFLHF